MGAAGHADATHQACPQCAGAIPVPPVLHLDAAQGPQAREALRGDTLQQTACPHCDAPVSAGPRLTWTDAARGLWVTAFPRDQVHDWRALELDAQGRLVFGWRALNEKLLAADADLDDVTLEKLKLLLMRDMQEPALPFGAELRLSGVDAEDDTLAIAVLDRQGRFLESLVVPADMLRDITADPEGWAALDQSLRKGPFVDLTRLIRG